MYFETISINTIQKYRGQTNSCIIDLRDSTDYATGHIPGAINIPYEKLDANKKKLIHYSVLFLYCERGNVSLLASRALSQEGYAIVNLYGGIHSYRGRLVR